MARQSSMGWIGPATDSTKLRAAAKFLLSQGAEQVIYLGAAARFEKLVETWASELGEDGRTFFERVVEVARNGSPSEIASLLENDRAVRRLRRLRTLPPPPTRAIEMLAGRIVLAVDDKKVLDEDDIANSMIIVFGRAEEWLFRRFGPRYFFTPGPLEQRRVGLLEGGGDGPLSLVGFDYVTGAELERHILHSEATRMTVTG